MIDYKEPMVGNRFIMEDSEYEIVFVDSHGFRYASVAGGGMKHLPLHMFRLYQEQQIITDHILINTSEVSLTNLNKRERETMNERLKYIDFILNKTNYPRSETKVTPLIKEFATKNGVLKPPSFRNFARWVQKYIESNYNPISLVPSHFRSSRDYFFFDSIVENIISTNIQEKYLTPQRCSLDKLYTYIKKEICDISYDDPNEVPKIPSERTIRRRIEKLDPYSRSKARHGIVTTKRDFKAAGQEIITDRALELVQADGNVLDVFVVDPETGEIEGRPYGTLILDHYSRCILGFHISLIPFSTMTLLHAIKMALTASYSGLGGRWELLKVDNGMDYTSNSHKNFSSMLGTSIEFGAPADPDSKAHVERIFRTLNSQLIHNLPGTTRSNPIDRGTYESEKKACLTLDDIRECAKDWVCNIYHRSLHQGTSRIPERLWKESIKTNPPYIYEEQNLNIMASFVNIRVISKGRINLHNLRWYSHALRTIEFELRGKNKTPEVHVFLDPLDLSKIYIRDPRNERTFIQADSTTSKYTDGLSLYEHQKILDELKFKSKQDTKSYNEYELLLAKWKLWEKIDQKEKTNRKAYARKRIARLKEVKKQSSEKVKNYKEPISKKPKVIPPQSTSITEFQEHAVEAKNFNWDEDDCFSSEEI